SGFFSDRRADARGLVSVWGAGAQSQPIVRLSAHVSYSYSYFTLEDHVFEIACSQSPTSSGNGKRPCHALDPPGPPLATGTKNHPPCHHHRGTSGLGDPAAGGRKDLPSFERCLDVRPKKAVGRIDQDPYGKRKNAPGLDQGRSRSIVSPGLQKGH